MRALDQNKWCAARKGDWPEMRVLAFDHRSQFEEMDGATPQKIGAFKDLCLQAATRVADGRRGYGILCDGRLGGDALAHATGGDLWIGRPVEWPGSRPLTLEPETGKNCRGLADWPKSHVVKVLCFYHPDDSAQMKAQQEDTVTGLFAATRDFGLEFLLEIIPSKVGPVDTTTTPAIIQRFYDLGVYPDWWKLEPFKTDQAWRDVCHVIEQNDPNTRGIVVLGLDAPVQDLSDSFTLAAKHRLVKGFAVGRTIFGDTARAWLTGNMDDEGAVTAMAHNFGALCDVWDSARVFSKGETS